MAITAETRTELIGVVVGLVGAAPGANNLSLLADSVDGGATVAQVAVDLASHPAFIAIYPNFLTNEEFANAWVPTLIGASGDEVTAAVYDEVIAAVVAALNAGTSRGEIMWQAINFLANLDEADGDLGAAAARFNNRTEVAEAYSVTTLQSADTLEELQGVVNDVGSTQASVDTALAAVTGSSNEGQTFTLTTVADDFTGTVNNDTFISNNTGTDAKGQTLTALDRIDGAGGNDTLIINDEEADIDIPGTVVVKNVENVEVNVAKDFKADVTSWTGLTNINLQVVGVDTTLVANGQTVIGDNLDGKVSITGAGTVDLADVGTKAVDIITGTTTTSASIDGGGAITMGATAAAATNSTTLTSAAVEDNTSAITIASNVLTSLDLNDVTGTVKVTNGATTAQTLGLAVDDFDGKLDDTAGAYDTLNIAVASASAFAVDVKAVEDINVSGSATATITDTDITKLESVTVTESAGLTIDFKGKGAALTTIDGSATSGDLDVTIDGGAKIASVLGGTGDDSLDVATKITNKSAAVDLGDGDDQFTNRAGLAHDDDITVDGGAGNDTLAILDGADVTKANAGIFKNFETLEVGGGTGTYELDLLGLTDITITGAALAGAVVLKDAAADAMLTSTSAAATDLKWTKAVSFDFADGTGTDDTLIVNLNAVDGDDDGKAEGNITVTKLTTTDVETLTINANATTLDDDKAATTTTDESTDADDYTHVVADLVGTGLENIVLNGDSGVKVTINKGSKALDFVDATGNTAGVEVVATAAAGGGVTFDGSAAADTWTSSKNGDTVQGNAGADTITFAAGADTSRYVAASDSTLVLTDTDADGKANVASGFDIIKAFTPSTDIIELSSSLGLATGDARSDVLQKGTSAAGGAAGIEAFIGDGVDFFDTGLVDRAVAIMDDGTDTYVFVDVNADGNYTGGTDLVIQVDGVKALTIADFSFG